MTKPSAPASRAARATERRPRSGRIPAGVCDCRSPSELNPTGCELVDRPAATEVGARGGEPLALRVSRESRSQQRQDRGQIVETTAVLAASRSDPGPPAL